MAITIVLSPEYEARLDFLASQTGHSKSSLLHEMIDQGVDDVEDYHLAVEVLERIRAGKERVYPSAEVRRDLALDD